MAQNEVLDPGRFFSEKIPVHKLCAQKLPKMMFWTILFRYSYFFGSNALAWQSYLPVVIVNVPAKNISELFQGVNDQK